TGARSGIWTDSLPHAKEIVLVGTLGRNRLIDTLAARKAIDVGGIAGAWEAFLVQSVEHPFPGVDRALVIAGSDKRGTMYGMFGLSGNMGVSPWYWWADVPVKHHREVFVITGRHTDGPPSVKYRGIFLNDEAPDLTNWILAKFGTVPPRPDPPVPPGVANYGHQFYERVFELLLRLKGNYLWPAMWNNAFNEDDPENPSLADTYGIIMGTSHQEPMLRAQKEWDRRYLSTIGTWNYANHPGMLEAFWRDGVRRNRGYESIVTIGLRGADDTPMAPGGPEANMALLEKIVGRQRSILAEEINPDVAAVPQLWCLYKEVMDFYNAGMRVPDDVTLLWGDDNWGNIRRVPTAEERKRKGGAGVYYHFEYHGGPRSYQWIDTNPIAKIWEQMSLAKRYGADRVWIVNVGHLKGYEFPLEYFMSLAWNAGLGSGGATAEYTRRWAQREFGSKHALQIARIIGEVTRYNGRCKPELLSPTTYSLVNYREAENVVGGFRAAASAAAKLAHELPSDARDAFYELVELPAKAGEIVNDLYVSAGRNALFAAQGRASANEMAARTRDLFREDTTLMGYFNRSFAGGKWDHFMDQPHLGYTGWQDPPGNSLRAIRLVGIQPPDSALMGVAVEGAEGSWPGTAYGARLPVFDSFNRQRYFIDIFNRGRIPFDYTALSIEPWIRISSQAGRVGQNVRIWISVDWGKAPVGESTGAVIVAGTGREVAVTVRAFRPGNLSRDTMDGFVEGDGCVSIESEHFTKNIGRGENRWIRIENYGRTLSGMGATGPPDRPAAVPGRDAPCLEYRVYLFTTGTVEVEGIFGPALNFSPGRGVRYAVSIDGDLPQVATLVPEKYSARNGNSDWERSVVENSRSSRTSHVVTRPGYHTLKIWMVDPGVVLEKVVVNTGGLRP
ncbi:MAG TPA: glycosyl hydrolase 115 family protein, partial [Bacteroidota bacterium]|nr:glycosyl hydrolase 115 family protein [Bacteroidota bacterium]